MVRAKPCQPGICAEISAFPMFGSCVHTPYHNNEKEKREGVAINWQWKEEEIYAVNYFYIYIR